MRIDTTVLVLHRPQGGFLCQGAFLRSHPGRLTAVMGGAGAGKTVLLEMLAGYRRPDEGVILFDGLQAGTHRAEHCHALGYVPQAEIMLPELTAEQSLDFRLRLQVPGLSRAERAQRIRQTLSTLGFGEKAELVLRQRIGTAESKSDNPSGGERRRINIAHELLVNPRALILDEPTSALSAVDARQVVETLRRLADTRGVGVVFSVHQPGLEVYRLFDDLLLLGAGGRMVYYGPAERAADYFVTIGGSPLKDNENPAEYVLSFVRKREMSDWSAERFAEARNKPGFEHLRQPLPGDR